MTENEAIEILRKYVSEWNYASADEYPIFTDELGHAINDVIQALEEIQQYRAIGTVEELKEIRNKAIDDVTEKLKESLLHSYRHLIATDTDGFEWLTTDSVETHIDEVVKQLKER